MYRTADFHCLRLRSAVLVPLLCCPFACDTAPTSIDRFTAPPVAAVTAAPAPSPTIPVSFAGHDVELWPFTATDFSGTGVDPINLIFVGSADVRSLRAALLALDGNRTAFGFPLQPPFDCTWADAIGGVQGAYTQEQGWTGSAIQLECGEYTTLRFHVRFFPAGEATVANAHIDVLVPGTTDHQVISWELGEALLAADMMRSGLLHATQPLGSASGITPAPAYRAIHPAIYNGLPAPLAALIGGPAQPVAAPVPVPNDGAATILNVAGEAPLVPMQAHRRYSVPFGQVIPKPFCAGAQDYVYVTGAVDFDHLVIMTPSGNYESHFLAGGELDVTPVDPTASPPAPTGEPYRARVRERYSSHVTNTDSRAYMSRDQRLWAPGGGALGSLHLELRLDGRDRFNIDVRCPA